MRGPFLMVSNWLDRLKGRERIKLLFNINHKCRNLIDLTTDHGLYHPLMLGRLGDKNKKREINDERICQCQVQLLKLKVTLTEVK